MILATPNSSESSFEIQWIRPTIETEMEEIVRVAEKFGITSEKQSFITQKIEDGMKAGELIDLEDALWAQLENTDSRKIKTGDFDIVQEFAKKYGRNDQILLKAMQQGKPMEAPVIIQYGDIYHLVSGNTRLMLTKALGKTPKVIIVRINETSVV